jgi:hypothetical protein
MNKLIRKLAVPVGAAIVAGTGFAYLSSGASSASYASQSVSTVGSYATYNVNYGIGDTPGVIGYVKFSAVPADNSHAEQADASTAMVQFNGGTNPWTTCVRSTSFGGPDSLNRNFTDLNVPGTGVTVNGVPESRWLCDVRSASVPATADITALNIQILH